MTTTGSFIFKACFRRRSLSLVERCRDLEGKLIFITGADGSGSHFDDEFDGSIALLLEMQCSVSATESLISSN